MMIIIKFLIISCLILVNTFVFAHGVVHQQIDELTIQLEQDHTNVLLLLNRALLFADDQNWQRAKQDFNAARLLDSSISIVDLHEAKMWFSADRADLSFPLINRYLQLNPEVLAAVSLRAKVNDKLGNSKAAVTDFTQVVQQSKMVLPEMYLQWAKAQTKVIPLNYQKIHQIIQLGLDKLGPLVVLLQYGIDFDRQQKNYQSALYWLEKLPSRLRQQPFWLVEKADLLIALNKDSEATFQYKIALNRLQEKRRLGRFNRADQKVLIKVKGYLKKLKNDKVS